MSITSVVVNTKPEDNDGIRLRLGSVIPQRLRSYEFHINWTQSVPLSMPEMELALSVLEEKFKDETKEIGNLLKTSAIRLIARKSTQAFFNIEMRKYSAALQNLKEAKAFVAECLDRNLFYEEYQEGCNYVFFGLELYCKVNNGCKLSELPLENIKRFSKVPAKAKMVVWAFRDFFLEDCARAKVQTYNFMEKMLSMEPCRVRWHFYLYKALRERRKIKPRRNSQFPDKSILDDPLSLSYSCLCLAEILNSCKEHQYPTRFGKLTIDNAQHLEELLRDRTLKILRLDSKLDGVYLNLSEIYMSTLDEFYRDYNLALICVEKALELNPHSTKAHHRMGILQFKIRSHKLATTHLREAIKDDENIGALYGLIQILMAVPNKNSSEIHSLFRMSLMSPKLAQVWDKRCWRTLHYLKGCFHFMLGADDEEAITSWIIAHDNGSEKWSYYFLNLSYQSHRFGWPTKRLNLTNVSDTLKRAAYIEKTQFKQVLLDICLEVDDAIRKDNTNSWIVPAKK